MSHLKLLVGFYKVNAHRSREGLVLSPWLVVEIHAQKVKGSLPELMVSMI